jgi:DNA-binding PadR family transcriptional regulator
MQELKGLDIRLSVIRPGDIGKLELSKAKLRIVVDAGSLEDDDYLKTEENLERLASTNFVLCTYDVSKISPELIKDLVKSHDKLLLTTSDLTILSLESIDKLSVSNEAIERFVKNDLETIVLALILNKPMCGTDIIKTVHKEFNILLSPGTIYPLLHSLEEKGLLKCEYKVKTKLYKPPEGAEPRIRSILNEHVQASKFLNKFLQSTELSGNAFE